MQTAGARRCRKAATPPSPPPSGVTAPALPPPPPPAELGLWASCWAPCSVVLPPLQPAPEAAAGRCGSGGAPHRRRAVGRAARRAAVPAHPPAGHGGGAAGGAEGARRGGGVPRGGAGARAHAAAGGPARRGGGAGAQPARAARGERGRQGRGRGGALPSALHPGREAGRQARVCGTATALPKPPLQPCVPTCPTTNARRRLTRHATSWRPSGTRCSSSCGGCCRGWRAWPSRAVRLPWRQRRRRRCKPWQSGMRCGGSCWWVP